MNVYPNDFENKIGFDRIRELIKENCISGIGIQKTEDMQFSTNINLINRLISETDEFKNIYLNEKEFPLKHFTDITSSLKKTKIEGAYLEVHELYDLKRSVEAIWAVLRFFNSEKKEIYPYLYALAGNVTVHRYIMERIDSILNKHGKIKDNASPELATIRQSLNNKKAGISRRLTSILSEIQKAGWVDTGLSLTIVNGRTVIPIDSSYKRKIQGLVHDESASGKTSYIEPTEVVDANNEIRELEYAENREILKILLKFADDIRPYLDDLLIAFDFIGEIDFIKAKASLAVRVKAEKPFISENKTMEWKEARHPLLHLALLKEKRNVIPLNISLTEQDRIILISGPNAGGKSVCLKTVGLLQYMLQCGLLVPMDNGSHMTLFDKLFIDIGDEQSLENDLSTYSSHLLNMKHFLKHADNQCLLLIDEFGTGTEPMIGGVIAESILDHLNQKKCFGVITTHYSNLKHFASANEGIVNGAMLFDSGQMRPLFNLEIGKPGSSFAFEIARKIGLPEEILSQATTMIGQD